MPAIKTLPTYCLSHELTDSTYQLCCVNDVYISNMCITSLLWHHITSAKSTFLHIIFALFYYFEMYTMEHWNVPRAGIHF